jgi:hypothetical protein
VEWWRVERAGVQRKRTVPADIHVSKKILVQLYFTGLLIATHVAHFAEILYAPRQSHLILSQNPVFQTSP